MHKPEPDPAEPDVTLLLFVYGTLQRGERYAEVLKDQRFLRAVRTPARFTLVSLGPYPALLDSGATAVAGELFEVHASALPALDEFEGPDQYRRDRLTLDDGTEAEAYFLRSEQPWLQVITSGDWRVHRA